jgi:4-hydroxy-tetrahydrodipicolinate synthase
MNPSIPDGVWPILLTPFQEDGSVDWPALDELVSFYPQKGVAGLFALGSSSEFLTLTEAERTQIVRRAVQACQGRIALVAAGNFGATLEEQAESMTRIAECGVAAVIASTSILPQADDLDGQLLRLAELTAAPLGVYECPVPEHRLLSPEQVRRLAHSGRFVFMKDTCRDMVPFAAKVAYARGTALKIYQANLKILMPSLEVGSHGFCGVVPVVAPELSEVVCDVDNHSVETRQRAHDRLMQLQGALTAHRYPASAKHVLQRRGVRLTARCRRVPPESFTQEDRGALDRFLSEGGWFAEPQVGRGSDA